MKKKNAKAFDLDQTITTTNVIAKQYQCPICKWRCIGNPGHCYHDGSKMRRINDVLIVPIP